MEKQDKKYRCIECGSLCDDTYTKPYCKNCVDNVLIDIKNIKQDKERAVKLGKSVREAQHKFVEGKKNRGKRDLIFHKGLNVKKHKVY